MMCGTLHAALDDMLHTVLLRAEVSMSSMVLADAN
jgi:hypothetical protein